MRANRLKAVILGLAVATACVAGCSSEKSNQHASQENSGTIGLQLQVAPGITVNTVTYTITGNGLNRTGSIDVTNSTSIQALIGGIPAGNGYTLTLSGTSTDGKYACSGSATFNVTKGATTAVNVHLLCKTSTNNGSVGVAGDTTVCPNVDSFTIDPTTANVGSSVSVAVVANDPDATQTVTYAWTATSGSFASASSASTTFKCTAGGAATVTVTVSNGTCSDTASATVTCTGSAPDAGTDSGPADSGPADTGPADTGSTTPTTSSILSAHAASCLSCAQTNGCLAAPAVTCETIAGSAPDGGPTRSSLCIDTLTCVISTKCASSGSGTPCYCGTASGAACLTPGAANGACKSQEEAGLETTNPSTIATGFGDTTKGGGVANALVQCLNDSGCTTCF